MEDLPVAEQGYDRDSVRAAFEAFYRHAAQLDATLRTLEAVELFQRQAEELRTDLRALRSSSWAEPPQPWTPTPTYGYRLDSVERTGIPPAVWRYAAEVAFLIGVAVALGIAQVRAWVIVAVMAAAWLIVGAAEWVAGRERVWAGRPVPQPVVDQPAVPPAAPAPQLPGDTEEVGWAAFEEAQEPSDAMTMVGSLPEEDEATPPGPEAPEPEPVAEAVAPEEAEVEPEPAAVEAPAGVDESGAEAEAEESAPEQAGAVEPEAREEPPARVEPQPAVEPQPGAEAASEPSGEAEPPPRRRWWRRRAEPEAEAAPEAAEPPRHVRVLPHGEHAAEEHGSWERGFDVDGYAPAAADETAAVVADGEAEPAEAAAEPAPRRRDRR